MCRSTWPLPLTLLRRLPLPASPPLILIPYDLNVDSWLLRCWPGVSVIPTVRITPLIVPVSSTSVDVLFSITD